MKNPAIAASLIALAFVLASQTSLAQVNLSISRSGRTQISHGWSTTHMPLKVFINSGEGVPHYKKSYNSLVTQACEDWTSASENLVSFVFVDSALDCDIRIDWIEYCREMGVPNACGLTSRSYDSSGYIQSAQIQLATSMPNRLLQGRQNTHTMRQTILHELGHALGLPHSHNLADVMYGRNMSQVRVLVGGIVPVNIPLPTHISKGDKRHLRSLYSELNSYNTQHSNDGT